MKTKEILMVGGVALLGFAVWQLTQPPATPPGIPGGSNYIPAGGSWNGYQNNSGAPAWVTTTGAIMGIVNGLATTLGSMPWDKWFPGGGTTSE